MANSHVLWCVLVYALLCLTVCHSYRAPLLCIWCLLAHYLLLDVIDSFVCCKYRCSRLTLSLTRSEAVLPVSVACCSLLHFLKHLRCFRTFLIFHMFCGRRSDSLSQRGVREVKMSHCYFVMALRLCQALHSTNAFLPDGQVLLLFVFLWWCHYREKTGNSCNDLEVFLGFSNQLLAMICVSLWLRYSRSLTIVMGFSGKPFCDRNNLTVRIWCDWIA